MATYSSNDFRPGLKIMFEGEPYAVEASEFVKPGKGRVCTRENASSADRHPRGKPSSLPILAKAQT